MSEITKSFQMYATLAYKKNHLKMNMILNSELKTIAVWVVLEAQVLA